MKRKGQAAMEFLMTYGWAILAAIIVIGVLAIFFSPSRLTTQSSIVTPPFYAIGAVVAAGQVDLDLQNNGAETLSNVQPSITITQPSGASCTDPAVIATMAANSNQIVSFTACSGLTSGDTFSGDLTVTYNRPNSALNLTSTGSVSGTVA